MSDTAKQSPLGVNALSGILQGIGLQINAAAAAYMGRSTGYEAGAGYPNGGSYVLGTVCGSTVLRMLTYSINRAYLGATVDSTVDNATYNNIISIGSGTIPAFGNSKPPTFTWSTPPGATGVGETWAPTGWGGTDQYTRTTPSDPPNAVTAWGFVRLLALQAWNEWNYNDGQPQYADFLSSWMNATGFIDQTNVAILACDNGKTYLDGVYSNMNDLVTADLAGVNLSFVAWGQDLIKLGKALDLSTISTFGLPSNLLRTIKQNNALTDSLVLALLSSDITTYELDNIITNPSSTTIEQEKSMYAAFTVIIGADLRDILITLNCKTTDIESLADLLNPRKLFPSSYRSLTVPVYNTEPGPTNSKTYYPIYNSDGSVNTQLNSPGVASRIDDSNRSGAPVPSTTQVATVDVTEALQQLNAVVGAAPGNNNLPSVTPLEPITTQEQSATTAVLGKVQQVQNIPSADSIASGQASSAWRPGRFQTEEN